MSDDIVSRAVMDLEGRVLALEDLTKRLYHGSRAEALDRLARQPVPEEWKKLYKEQKDKEKMEE
jgi:hypothetical protein